MVSWSDQALILAWRAFGEHDAILDVFGKTHGRGRGLVRGGASRRRRAMLEPGNELELEWRGRLSGQLGYFAKTELIDSRSAAIFDDALALSAMSSVLAILLAVLAENIPKPEVYESSHVLFDIIADREIMPPVLVRWEAGLLTALGYGLDLRHCALTGQSENLCWVSPRTGRAAGAEAGQRFPGKLLPLPAFMTDKAAIASPEDIGDGLELTGYFLEKALRAEAQACLPSARERFIDRLVRSGLAERSGHNVSKKVC